MPARQSIRTLHATAIVAAIAAGQVGWAPAGAAELVPGGTAVVSGVLSGDTLRLASGDILRLAGIAAPEEASAELASQAKAALAGLVDRKTLRLSYGGRRVDRHGRLIAHVHDANGLWVQGEMLTRGLARVASFADNRARLTEMLLFEAQARAAHRGLWAHAAYLVRQAPETPKFLNSFQIVEGRVLKAAKVRGQIYLNFGADWRTDFTAAITRGAARLYAKAGRDPMTYQGRRIRVRGWLKPRNGPMITVTHPEQIELLPERTTE